MTIESLQRVMWRLRSDNPHNDTPYWTELQKAIIKEIGVDKRTYISNRTAIIKLGWIKAYGKKRFKLTNKDLSDS